MSSDADTTAHDAEPRRWGRRGRDDEPASGVTPGGTASDAAGEASVTGRLAAQWAALSQLRDERLAERRTAPEPPPPARSNTDRAQVPWGLDLAAAWGWRLLVIGLAGYVIYRVIAFFSVVTLPLVVALLLTALATPVVGFLSRRGLPRGLAAILTVVLGLAGVVALLTFAGQQVVSGANDLADSVVEGLGDIRFWLKNGPLNASESQINDTIRTVEDAIRNQTQAGGALQQVTEIGATIGHLFAGFFIVLFASFFFLSDGARIWAWIVRLAPRAARPRVDSSGRVAWISLTQFVRATVIVAFVDAVGIMIIALILQVPFVLAIGVLVFVGAFIPLVGATVAGSVAVLVALVDQGPITALLMFAGVILVQQIEGHILQPFLMGRWVSVHPLGVIVALAAGIIVGGVAGALVAVPLAAALNAVVLHLSAHTEPGDDPREVLEDLPPPGEHPPDHEAEADVDQHDEAAPLASDPGERRD